MAAIKIPCKCGSVITINIKTIDTLRTRCEQLEKENAELKKTLNLGKNGFDDLLNMISRGKK